MLAVAQVDIVGYLRDDIYHLLVFPELESLLREIAKAHSLTNVKLTAIRLHLAQEHLDESRFSRTIITYDTHLLKSGKVVVEVIENHLLLSSVIKSLAHILAFEDFRTNIYGRSLQSYLTIFDALLGYLLQLIESILTIFRLMTSSLRLTTHPVQLSAIEILGMLDFCTQIIHALLALFQIVSIVSTIGVDGLIVEFQNGITYLIEEETVVRNHEDGLVATIQITLQPLYHLQVEVIGRLIEHQEVRLIYQHIGECHTLLLSSTQLSHRLVHIGDMQLCEDLLCLEHLFRIILMIEAGFQHAFLWIKLRRLFQIAHLQIASIDDITTLMSLLIHKDRHQCRFTRAIACHESHFLSFSYREGYFIKKNLCSKAFGEVLNV